jgi:DHA1 family bicyclomycin/chloramphenicol resistance-like MFS transporter
MRSPRGPLVLFALGVLGAFGPLSMDAYLPSLPRVVSELHTSPWAVQLSVSTSLAGLALGQLVAGAASDRYGRRPLLIIGCCGFILSSALCAISPDVVLLITFRLAQGCSGAAGIVVSRAVVRDLFSGTDLGRIFSRMLLVSGTAPIVAPILGAQILRFTGWRGVFWILALIGLAILALTVAVVPETLAVQNRTNHTVRADLKLYRRISRDRRFRPYMLSAGVFSGVLFGFISGSSFVVQNIYHHSATTFSFVFAGVSAVTVTLGQCNARLVRTRSMEALLRAGMSVAAFGSVGVLLVAIAGIHVGILLFVFALILAVSPYGVVNPNSTALAMRHYGRNAGAASALMGVSTFLVGGTVAPLVGIAGDHTMVPLGIVMAICSISGLLLLITLGNRSAPDETRVEDGAEPAVAFAAPSAP